MSSSGLTVSTQLWVASSKAAVTVTSATIASQPAFTEVVFVDVIVQVPASGSFANVRPASSEVHTSSNSVARSRVSEQLKSTALYEALR